MHQMNTWSNNIKYADSYTTGRREKQQRPQQYNNITPKSARDYPIHTQYATDEISTNNNGMNCWQTTT